MYCLFCVCLWLKLGRTAARSLPGPCLRPLGQPRENLPLASMDNESDPSELWSKNNNAHGVIPEEWVS